MGIGKFLPAVIRTPLRTAYVELRKGPLGRNRFTYRLEKARHLRAYAPNRDAAPDKAVFDELVSEGVVVIRQFLDRTMIQQIVAEIEAPIHAVAEGRYDGPNETVYLPKSGVFRLLGADKELAPLTHAFFENSFIHGMAQAMSPQGVVVKDSYVDYKVGVGREDGNFTHHIDHWRMRLKAFLLLGDMGDDNAPYVYVKRSHREDRWRRKYDYGLYSRGYDFCTLTPQHVRRIAEKYGYEEVTILGSAGDLILAHNRGIHRASILRAGTRLQLGQLFVINE